MSAISSKERPIWIVQIGEPVPHDSSHQNERLFRSGILAKHLAEEGADVVWWASTVDHARKIKRFDEFKEVEIQPRLKVAFLDGCMYERNLSFSRIRNHVLLARQFEQLIPRYEKPGVMVLNYPTPELCDVGVRFGREAGIPTVVDIRDLWPDDIVNLCPAPMKLPAKIMTMPMKRMARRIFREASHLTGVTSGYLDWGVQMGGRDDIRNHRVFHLAYANPNGPEVIDQIIGQDNPHDQDVTIRLVFAGMLGVSVEMRPIFEAVRRLRSQGHDVVVDICGKGDKYELYQREHGAEEGFEFHGFVNQEHLDHLFRKAHFGVLPYLNLGSLGRNIPNKVGEYLSYGLPILSTLSGASAELIESESIGSVFDPNQDSTPAAIADRVISSMSDVEEWRAQRRRCCGVYSEKFDARKVYSDFGGWIRELAVS